MGQTAPVSELKNVVYKQTLMLRDFFQLQYILDYILDLIDYKDGILTRKQLNKFLYKVVSEQDLIDNGYKYDAIIFTTGGTAFENNDYSDKITTIPKQISSSL